MAYRIQQFFIRILSIEPNREKRARSIAVGMALAISPLLGIQTPVLFLVAFIFRLNSAVVFAVVYAINNPWSMVPIIIMNYFLGQLLVERALGIDLRPYDPAWSVWVTEKIAYYTGMSQLCFWYYCIGGAILAGISGILTYVAIKTVQDITVAHPRENDHSE
jgi:uncharacterized protein (DUF2062 family)